MDSKRRSFIGSGIMALFIVGLLLGATFTTALAQRVPPDRAAMRDASPMKDISGSFVWLVNAPYIAPGNSGSWTFGVINNSPDIEWLDETTLDFPAGINVTSATDFINQAFPENLIYDGTTGDGAFVTWADPDGYPGEIWIGEYAYATVNVTVSGGFSGDVVIPWTISGDDDGGVPHDISGSVIISNMTVTNEGAPYYVTGDFDNVLCMQFILADPDANDWLDALTIQLGPLASGITSTSFDNMELWHDFNGNGLFEPGVGDLLVGSLIWDGVDSWVVSGLGAFANNPVTTAGDRYFLSVDVGSLCPDDANIQLMIPQLFDAASQTVFNPGDEGIFLLGGDTGPAADAINTEIQIVNRYSVMAEYTVNNVTDPDWVGPNDNVLILDFEVPGNWGLADGMTAVTFFNTGTADSVDLKNILMWRDDGIAGWGDGGETVVDTCLPYIDAQHWYLDLSATPEVIAVTGARFFLTGDVDAAAVNNHTIQMGVPQTVDVNTDGAFTLGDDDEGVFFASRNDGPNDGDLVNSEAIVIDSGPPDIGFTNGVGSGVPDANSYGSYARQTTVTTPVLAVGSGHSIADLMIDTNLYGLAWGAMMWSRTIKWTVTYDETIVTPDKWVVEGAFADDPLAGPGVQANRATTAVAYATDGGEITFTLTEATPADGDYFYFFTTRNIVGLANPDLVDQAGERPGDEIQDELDKDEIIVSIDGITDPGSGVATVRIYCTFDNSIPTTSKATMKDLVNVAGNRWWTNDATPDNILESEVMDTYLVQFIVQAIDNVGNIAESEIQKFEIDATGPTSVAPTFTWNTDNTLLPPSVANVGDILNINVDLFHQEVPSFTEIVGVKCDITNMYNATSQQFMDLVHGGDGWWTGVVTIQDQGGTTGMDDDEELPAGLAAVVQIFDHIGNMDETVIWNVADNANFNGFDNLIPETPPPTVSLDQDNTTVPTETVNIGDVVQVEVDVNAVDDSGVLFVTVDMRNYGTSYGAAEMLNDGGYDGDDLADDGIYSREFLVEDAGGFAVDQLNLDGTVSAILTDDAGNPDTTPEMIAPGNTLDIDTDAPGATSANFDIAVNIGGVNWLNYSGDPDIANPGDRAVVRWNSGPTGDNETDNLMSVIGDLSEWGGPSADTMLVDEGGYQGGSYNDWDGDHGEDLDLYGLLHDFTAAPLDVAETYCHLTVTDDAGNVVTVSSATDEGTPAEPLSVDLIYPVGSLTVSISHAANPPKALYAGINDTLFFTFNASATSPFDIFPPNGGAAVDLTDFGFPFDTNPLVLTRGAAPDTMKWYGSYVIVGAGNVGAMGPEIAVDADIDFQGTLYDDALNEFVDNFGQMIHCDNTTVVEIMPQYTSCWITHDVLADDIAAIGDTLWFGFDNSDATGQDVGDIRNNVAGVYVDIDRDGAFETADLQLTDPDTDEYWMAYYVVTGSEAWDLEDETDGLVTFGFYAMDNGMNTSTTMAPCPDSVLIDNMRPEGDLAGSITDITTDGVPKVSVGDKVNVMYNLTGINDNVQVSVDLSPYGLGTDVSLGATLSISPSVEDVDDPALILDVLPGNVLIDQIMLVCVNPPVTDNAGNTYDPSPLCIVPFDSNVYGVDNDAPVTAAPTLVLLDDHAFVKGNGLVNLGDRIDVICDMSAIPDMAGGRVTVDLSGYGGSSAAVLTDDAFSEGGEGDLVFSFVLQHAAYTGGYMKGFVVGGGADGAPGIKGVDDDNDGQVDNAEELFLAGDDMPGDIDTDPPAESTNPPEATSAVEARAYDDDGCPAENTEFSPEFTEVVDTQEPDLDDVDVDFFDSDGSGDLGYGVVNIGDTLVVYVDAITDVGLVTYDHYAAIPVTVDMSAYGYSEAEPISTVFDTTGWGAPATWTRTFLIVEGDNGIDVGPSDSDSRVPGWGYDNADNWQFSPTYSSPLPYQVDTDMPIPVQNLTAAPVQGGRIKLEWDYPDKFVYDPAYFHIYQGAPDADLIDYTTPTESVPPLTTVWYSDVLEMGHTYLFGVRVEDDAGNIEENTNVVSGEIPDSVVPFATVTYPPNGNLLVWGTDGAPGDANVDDDGANGVDDPGEVGYGDTDDYTVDLVATMSDNDVVQADYYWRIKDTDPLLEGDQPGPWEIGGTVPADYPQQETFTATLDLSVYPSDIYEIIVVPTDGADNFPTHAEAYDFSHVEGIWDNDPPSLIYLMVNGDASPDENTLIPQGIIPMIVHGEDYSPVKGVPSYLKVSLMPDGYMAPVVAYEMDDVATWPHHFEINTTGYPNGPMDIYLWLMDPFGNAYTMDAVTVTIEDVAPPVAVITNPEYGDHITGSAYPIIVEAGVDAYGNPVTDIARVDAYYSDTGSKDWTWIGFDTTPEDDQFVIPWNTTGLTDGANYYLYCEITDNSGNSQDTEIIMVVKDDSALPVTIEIDDVVMVNGEERIHGDAVKITALCSDPDIASCGFGWRFATDPDQEIFYHNIATVWGAPFAIWFDTENVGGANWDQQNYPIVIRVKPKDTAGNEMEWVTYDVTVDNKAPWFSIYSVNGFVSSGDVAVMGGTDVDIVVHTMDDDVALLRLQAIYDGNFMGIAELTAGTLDPTTGMWTYTATWTPPVVNDDTEVVIHAGGRDLIDNASTQQGGDDWFDVIILGTETMTVLMAVPQHGTNIMGNWWPGDIQGTTGNTDVASAELQFQTPGETVWHGYGVDDEGPTWENPLPIFTSLLTDGDWNMRWLARDADGNPDPSPVSITVTVDNTAPVAVIDPFDEDKVSREVLFTAECSDGKGTGSFPASVQYVDFMIKEFTDDTGDYTSVGCDYVAPYEFMFDTRTVDDGRYHVLALGTDNAGFVYGYPGNTQDPTYAAFEVLEFDNNGPADLMISDIGDNHNPATQGETLPMQEDLPIVVTSTDQDVAWMRVSFRHIDDFDYNEIGTDTEIEIVDDLSVGTFEWTTTALTQGEMYVLEVCSGDDVGNETWTYYDFHIGLAMALILSIDDETGEIVAECNEPAKLVKFDFQPQLKGQKSKGWEGIGLSEVDEDGYAKIIWHYQEMLVPDGQLKVRAWASDDSEEWGQGMMLPEDKVGDWTLTKTGNHFDIQQSTLEGFDLATPNDNSDPELIQVNIWVPSGAGAPSLYVVIDDAPNNPAVGPTDYEVPLIPSANDPNLYEPDPNNQVRLTPISTGGVADFFATLPSISSKGGMDVLTDQIVVAEVTLTDGGSTSSESGNWDVIIPPGALYSGADGLVARDVAVTPQSPAHQLHLKPVGGAVSVFMMSNYDYYFNSGYYATFVAHYDDADVPEGIEEDQLSAAWWNGNGYPDGWHFDGLRIIDHDAESNTVTFNADYFGGSEGKSGYGGTIYTLIVSMHEENCGTIEMSDPVALPTVDGVTWAMPILQSFITDAVSSIDEDMVEMWLDGVRIWADDDPAYGWGGHYDWISGELRLWWSDYYYEGGWRCAPPLVGGEHQLKVTAMNEVENYCTMENTFTVEYPHEGSLTDVMFLGDARLMDGVWYTDATPKIQANVHDPFAGMWLDVECYYGDDYYYDYYAGVRVENLQVEIDDVEYCASEYYCDAATGTWGVMIYQQTEELDNGEHTYSITLTRNQVSYTVSGTFVVDSYAPTLSGFDGGYVGATPVIDFVVSDLGVGVDLETIHLDLYQMTQTTSPPNDAEDKEFLYTAFPSMLAFAETGNDVSVSYSPVINLQDGEELEITLYGGTFSTYGYDFDDTGDRLYRDSDGIADRVGNILTPATKRYIVDAMGPEVAEMEVMEDGMICYVFKDLGAGVTCDDIEITMDGEAFEDYECEQLDRTRVAVCFDPGDLGAEFKIKITDAAGNFTIERFINETAVVALGEDAHCYPNPATADHDHTTIVYTVSKRTGVEVSLKIYDFAGEPVKTLYRGEPSKVGVNEVAWYFDDDDGKAVGRGAYLCRIVAKDDSKTSSKVVKIAVAQSH
jgi:hypothetical protein